jgi:hypothetical protein
MKTTYNILESNRANSRTFAYTVMMTVCKDILLVAHINIQDQQSQYKEGFAAKAISSER